MNVTDFYTTKCALNLNGYNYFFNCFVHYPPIISELL